jgi:hypothetical protein
VGKLTSESPTWRIVAAILGIALGALGVGIAIWWTSKVLAPTLNSFRTADERPDVTQRVLGDRELVGLTYRELKEGVTRADERLAEAQKEGEEAYAKALKSRRKGRRASDWRCP